MASRQSLDIKKRLKFSQLYDKEDKLKLQIKNKKEKLRGFQQLECKLCRIQERVKTIRTSLENKMVDIEKEIEEIGILVNRNSDQIFDAFDQNELNSDNEQKSGPIKKQNSKSNEAPREIQPRNLVLGMNVNFTLSSHSKHSQDMLSTPLSSSNYTSSSIGADSIIGSQSTFSIRGPSKAN